MKKITTKTENNNNNNKNVSTLELFLLSSILVVFAVYSLYLFYYYRSKLSQWSARTLKYTKHFSSSHVTLSDFLSTIGMATVAFLHDSQIENRKTQEKRN